MQQFGRILVGTDLSCHILTQHPATNKVEMRASYATASQANVKWPISNTCQCVDSKECNMQQLLIAGIAVGIALQEVRVGSAQAVLAMVLP